MALTLNTVRLFLELRGGGATFDRVATIGRMWWMILPEERQALAQLLSRANLPADACRDLVEQPPAYADPFFRLLGCQHLDAIDYSAYEHASVLHDMNLPMPADADNRYDIVFDGGCLEHVFNYPVALANCMRMVKPSGYLVLHTPCNNMAGHGFYQFSPELYFRVFTEQNGFTLERIVVHEVFRTSFSGQWYEVSDPAQIRRRVCIDSGHGLMLLVVAKKTQSIEPFRAPPYQADYERAWASAAGTNPAVSSQTESGQALPPSTRWGWITSFIRFLDRHCPRLTSLLRSMRNPLHNRDFFTRVD
jgi:SAM-dependent methyltransferase